MIRSVGPLKVWADPLCGRIMIGNAAAARAALSDAPPLSPALSSSPVTAIPMVSAFDEKLAPLGENGRIVRLRIHGQRPGDGFCSLLSEAITTRASSVTLDLMQDDTGNRTMLRDGVALLTERPGEHCFEPLVETLIAACEGEGVAAIIHGSAVVRRGKAIAFAGRSGSGKSTLAALLCAGGGALYRR